jgi:hypothetical protein
MLFAALNSKCRHPSSALREKHCYEPVKTQAILTAFDGGTLIAGYSIKLLRLLFGPDILKKMSQDDNYVGKFTKYYKSTYFYRPVSK